MILSNNTKPHLCNCVGPQNQEPVCPCQMRSRNIRNIDGRWIEPQKDLGEVRENSLGDELYKELVKMGKIK